MESVSAALLEDPLAGGWQEQRDKALVGIIERCFADLRNKLSQYDNSTRSI